ncbi:MAG: hypothetical protein FWF51_11755 [Chitinivibrionia bacterium]|nr:hypothetical protein [Chitinivibrionia bacterium]
MNFFISKFSNGFVSVFDISGQKLLSDFGHSGAGFVRDRISLRNDWKKTGGDIRRAIGKFKNER